MYQHSKPVFFRVASGRAMRLGRRGGELTVLTGRVWLTREHDLGDQFIECGQRLRLSARANAVIEPARHGEAADVRWQPSAMGWTRAVRPELSRAAAALSAIGFRVAQWRGLNPSSTEPACPQTTTTATTTTTAPSCEKN